MSTKLDAALKVIEEVRRYCFREFTPEGFVALQDALRAFDAAAPDEAEAGREERTEPRNEHLDSLLNGVHHGTIPGNVVIAASLVEIEYSLRALAASVKERR